MKSRKGRKKKIVDLRRDTSHPRRTAPPTDRIPGSTDKIEVLASRAQRGQSLFSTADAASHDAEVLTWTQARNHSMVCTGKTQRHEPEKKVEPVSVKAQPPCTLGEHLRSAREKAGLSRKQLCFRAGISDGVLSRAERDLRVPTINVLTALADVLGISIDTLIGRTPPA